jgi:hypothetical protein
MCRFSLRKLMALSLSLIFLVVSCTPQQKTQPAWVARMLGNPVCLAPCWENITPGVTTRDELSQLLDQNPNFSDIKASEGVPYGPVLMWCVGEPPCGNGDLSAFSAFDNKGIVQELYLGPGTTLYLKDFIPRYGPPEKVAFSDPVSGPGYVVVDLLYPKSGLVLEFSPKNKGSLTSPSINFSQDLDVVRIIFTVPGLDYYYSNNVIAKPLEIYYWKGYTDYP